MTATQEQVRAYLGYCRAIADAIKELGSVPSGHLYATVMGHMTLESYNHVIMTLTTAKLVHCDPNHLLTWIGDKVQNVAPFGAK